MATIANITVKKADAVTDIVWSAINGAAGNSPALWRSATAVGTVGQQPWYSLAARANGDGTVRRVDGKVSFPSVYTDSASSLTKIRSTMNITFSVAVPQDVASTDLNEFSAQATALVFTSMTRGAITSGFAPN